MEKSSKRKNAPVTSKTLFRPFPTSHCFLHLSLFPSSPLRMPVRPSPFSSSPLHLLFSCQPCQPLPPLLRLIGSVNFTSSFPPSPSGRLLLPGGPGQPDLSPGSDEHPTSIIEIGRGDHEDASRVDALRRRGGIDQAMDRVKVSFSLIFYNLTGFLTCKRASSVRLISLSNPATP